MGGGEADGAAARSDRVVRGATAGPLAGRPAPRALSRLRAATRRGGSLPPGGAVGATTRPRGSCWSGKATPPWG